MKKLLTSTLLALAAALTAGAQSYTLPSKILGVEKSCTVYLPDGYDRSGESYPVLYLLHGASGCHTDWTQKGYMRRITDETVASGMARPMIVVMPDAAGEGKNYTGRAGATNSSSSRSSSPPSKSTTASSATRPTGPFRGSRWAAAARRSTPCATPKSSARPAR